MCRSGGARGILMVRIAALGAFCLLLVSARPVHADDPPGFALMWGGLGTGPGKFHVPIALAVDVSGNVYVAEFNNHRVQKFTNDGVYLGQWGSLGKLEGQLESPSGIGIDKAGDVYVVDTYNNRISKFTNGGTFLSTWGSLGPEPGQFNLPVAIAFDGAGYVYVTDLSNSRVQKFTTSGTFLLAWGAVGSGNGEFLNPTGIAVDGSDRVYVVDSGNSRIQVFDSNGGFLDSWGTYGEGEGQFLYPLGIDFDEHQNAYVSDIETNRITKFRRDGTFLTMWGARGVGGGYFDGPFDVAVDANDNVFVADSYHNLIQKFDPRIPPPGPRPDYTAKLLLHITEPVTKNICQNGLLARCGDARVSATLSTSSGPFYFAYLVTSRGYISSLAGFQCGISYEHGGARDADDGQGVDIFGWTLCADREFPTPPGVPPGAPAWPGPGSGNLITWNYLTNCQFGDVAVAGYFYLAAYSPDVLRLTPRPADGITAVADCIPVDYRLGPGDLGFVAFSASGNVPGCNPCLMDCTSPTNVRPTTWSAIKALFH